MTERVRWRDSCLLTTEKSRCLSHHLASGRMYWREMLSLMTKSNVEVDHVEVDAEAEGNG